MTNATAVSTLAEFLRARIVEDEVGASGRALAECVAKRWFLEDLEATAFRAGQGSFTDERELGPRVVAAKMVAAVYADHPDYASAVDVTLVCEDIEGCTAHPGHISEHRLATL